MFKVQICNSLILIGVIFSSYCVCCYLKVWINAGDIILIGLRDYQDTKADVILKYNSDEARNLKAYGELPENGECVSIMIYLFETFCEHIELGAWIAHTAVGVTVILFLGRSHW